MNKKKSMILFILAAILLLAGYSGAKNQISNESESSDGQILTALHTTAAAAESGSKLLKLDDLEDKRIGVLLGSVHDTYANKKYPDAKIMQYKNISDLLLAVKEGKVDAAFYNQESLLEIMRHDKELGFLAEKVYTNPIGAGFNQNDDSLRESFNLFLQQSKENGIYDDMVKRWIRDGNTEMPEIANSKQNGTFVVGIVSDKGLPFMTVKDNALIGFDAELATRFAVYLDKKIVFADMEFGSLIAAAATHKIDMITSSLMITEERQKQIDFSDPYYELGASVFALKSNLAGSSGKMSTLDDIADKKVGVATGTIFDAFVADKYPKAKIFRYDSSADMVMAIRTEKIDVALVDAISAGLLVKSNPELGILSDDILTKPLGIGFSKNDLLLREKFNRFLKKIKTDGTYKEMYERWCVNDPEQAVMPDIPAAHSGEKIVLGVAVADLPYVAVVNGKYVGLDIELLERFAAEEGLQLELVTMEFGSLVTALAAGKVDMIADGIAITPERSKQVAFSDSYQDFKTAVIALKKNLSQYEGQAGETPAKPFYKRVADSFYNNMIVENRYRLIVDGLKTTAIISIFAVLFGTLLGALICFMRMHRNKLLSGMARIYISILRGIPVLVLLMLVFYVVFASININPVLVAVIAFGMNFAAYVSEMFRTAIESIDKGQQEAGIAGGFTPLQTFLYIIMPQAVRQVLPVYKGEFISLVKMTSIVGYIAVQDLTKASDIIRSRTFDPFFPLIMVAVLYFMLSWLLALALDYINMKTDPKRNRNTRRSNA